MGDCATHRGAPEARSGTPEAFLEAALELFLKLLAVAAAQRQTRAVLQDHHVLAVEPRLQLFHALGVDDARAVDAHEAAAVEARIHAVHRLAEEMRLLAEVKAHVVARRFVPVELIPPQEYHTSSGLSEPAIASRWPRPSI